MGGAWWEGRAGGRGASTPPALDQPAPDLPVTVAGAHGRVFGVLLVLGFQNHLEQNPKKP